MRLNQPLKDLTIVAFDTETTGAYPLGAEICEIAAVKYRDGRITEEFQSLVKPSQQMSDFVIGIHGITNEMVSDAPKSDDVIPKFYQFLQDAVPMAHHAAFDLGFVAQEFERLLLPLPKTPALCTSILSRKLFTDSENHRLQTLIKYFGIHQGVAHRALDDSRACLDVGLRCFEKYGWLSSFDDILKFQTLKMEWAGFSLSALQDNECAHAVVVAIKRKLSIEISYRTASDRRVVTPFGIVRNPEGDYFVAYDGASPQHKRYYFTRVVAARIIN